MVRGVFGHLIFCIIAYFWIGTDIEVSVRPAALKKCPRCWTYTRPVGDELCKRCTDVVRV